MHELPTAVHGGQERSEVVLGGVSLRRLARTAAGAGVVTSGHRRLYGTTRWRLLARDVIASAGGRCQVGLPGCTVRATSCDHIVPAVELYERGQIEQFFNPALLRASCRSCNSRSGGWRLANSRKRQQRQADTAEARAIEYGRREREHWDRIERERVAAERRPAPNPQIH